MQHIERIELIEAVAKHVLAHVLIVGFLGLAYVSVLGFVDLSSPTVAGFLGILIGAVGLKIEPAIVSYFGRRRIEDQKAKEERQ